MLHRCRASGVQGCRRPDGGQVGQFGGVRRAHVHDLGDGIGRVAAGAAFGGHRLEDHGLDRLDRIGDLGADFSRCRPRRRDLHGAGGRDRAGLVGRQLGDQVGDGDAVGVITRRRAGRLRAFPRRGAWYRSRGSGKPLIVLPGRALGSARSGVIAVTMSYRPSRLPVGSCAPLHTFFIGAQ